MKNLTPEHLRCGKMNCPGIYETDDGRLEITGELVIIRESVAMAAGHEVKQTEATIRIDPALLETLKQRWIQEERERRAAHG